ncbi:hypothetical protein LEP1GSC037_0077 [Leptospira interrogans str. 2006001854]|uniref:Uncharacterized protein n=1 Tax=Leptospira interrogans str. 2006001854 TaxID=1001590 RepID=M6GG72_LEPIR|nr:hypothetical protein LEP1GSC037_0077 [Leptospira interrogans str. 2006001854]
MFHIIDFSHLILIGNTFILLCLLLLYYTIEDKRKFILISPIFLAILNFSNWETQTWAMASLSNYPVIYFGFLSLYFLSKDKLINFVLGIFFVSNRSILSRERNVCLSKRNSSSIKRQT